MKPSTIVAICVRLFSIFLWVYLAKRLLVDLTYLLNWEDILVSSLAVTHLVGVALLAVFLWKFPLFVAFKLVDFDDDEPKLETPSELSLYNIGLLMAGIFVGFFALSDLSYWVSYFAMLGQYSGQKPAILAGFYVSSDSDKAAFFATLIELAISIILIFGAKKISRFVVKFRRAGL